MRQKESKDLDSVASATFPGCITLGGSPNHSRLQRPHLNKEVTLRGNIQRIIPL